VAERIAASIPSVTPGGHLAVRMRLAMSLRDNTDQTIGALWP
jgi:hypothetical protein